METYIMNIMSCVISYILISLIALIRLKLKFLEVIPNTPIYNSCISVILVTMFAILFAIISSSKKFSDITVKLFNKTMNDDIWSDILDFKSGSNLKIYLKNEPYYIIGHHKNHEEKGNESWLAVSAFAKFDKNTNIYYNNEPSFENDENVIYTVRFSDIEHIEIF